MEPTRLPDISSIPNFEALSPDRQEQLLDMARNMSERGLPESLILTGLRSTAALLMDQQREQTPRIETEEVRRFLRENRGKPVARRSRAVPRKETKTATRDRLLEQLTDLLNEAGKATRRHEILRARRLMLGQDQGYIRRLLGSEGTEICDRINAWLVNAATHLRRR